MKVQLKPLYAVCKLLYLFMAPNSILINNTNSLGVRVVKAPILAVSLSINLVLCSALHVMAILVVMGQAISAVLAVGVCIVTDAMIGISQAIYRLLISNAKTKAGRWHTCANTYRAWSELADALSGIVWSSGQLVTAPFIYTTKLLRYVLTGKWTGLYPLAETLSQLGLDIVIDYFEGLLMAGGETVTKALVHHAQEKKLLDILAADMRKKLPSKTGQNDGHVINSEQLDQEHIRLIRQTAAVCVDTSMKIVSDKLLKDKRVGWYPENVKQSLEQFCVQYQAKKTSDYFYNLCEGIKKAEKNSDEYKALKQQLEWIIRENSMWFLENYVFNQSEMVEGTETKRLKAG